MFSTRWKAGQALAGRNDVKSKIRKAIFERGGNRRRLAGRRCVYQKETVTFLLGKEFQEILFRHHQLALKNAIGQSTHHTQTHRTIRTLQNEFIAELEVQHIGRVNSRRR